MSRPTIDAATDEEPAVTISAPPAREVRQATRAGTRR
jgi:hypothetical protein